MSAAIDPTTTAAWSELTAIAEDFHPDLRAWFAEEPQRAQAYAFDAADLHVDLSKSFLTADVLAGLIKLAEETKVAERRDAMFGGERINVTEDRAVLHTALRLPADATLELDGRNVATEVHAELAKMYALADAIRSGRWTGLSGKRIQTVVNIGIGGSDLGPVMVYEALLPYAQPGLTCRFVSNIDPADIWTTTKDLDPETTLFIVASKTFTTLETMTNARVARTWLLDGLKKAGLIADPAQEAEAVAKHFLAVSTALDLVSEFGIAPENVLGFWDWVGGRYSVDSVVGASVCIAIGPDHFQEFLAGFASMDEHFKTAAPVANVPMVMGLLNVFYNNFLDAESHAVLPYQQFLHRFPAYLQQLTMESNGKSVRFDGTAVTTNTGEVFWGEPGTNGQHAFFQLLHQGTRLIPADFIAVAKPAHVLTDGDVDLHDLLMSNFFAQTAALAFGKTAAEVRAEGTAEAIVGARVFPGNRPTAAILAAELSPRVLGELIALYEHITFVEGAVWGIDSFDQWGVELGKTLAKQLAPAVAGDTAALAEADPSTRAQIEWYLAHRP